MKAWFVGRGEKIKLIVQINDLDPHETLLCELFASQTGILQVCKGASYLKSGPSGIEESTHNLEFFIQPQ